MNIAQSIKMRFKRPKTVESLRVIEDSCTGCGQCATKCKREVFAMANGVAYITNLAQCVARNLIIDRSRKRREEQMPYLKDGDRDTPISEIFLRETNTPEDELATAIINEEFESALLELPHEQRSVYELNELQGIPFSQISEATGIPINTLISRKRYAVQHLCKRLAYLT